MLGIRPEDDGMSSFGAYNPSSNEIILQTKNRKSDGCV
jgi:hypothetical protein